VWLITVEKASLISFTRTLIAAARGTTSTLLARIFHILTQRPDAQIKLRKEVLDACAKVGQKDLSHDDLMALPYLDAIVRETLRL
jgi:cytochrome P450